MQISPAGCDHVSLWSERVMARARNSVFIRSVDTLLSDARCGVGSTHSLRQQPSLPKFGPSSATIRYPTDAGATCFRSPAQVNDGLMIIHEFFQGHE